MNLESPRYFCRRDKKYSGGRGGRTPVVFFNLALPVSGIANQAARFPDCRIAYLLASLAVGGAGLKQKIRSLGCPFGL